jgi:acyl-CoA thioesterase FadM
VVGHRFPGGSATLPAHRAWFWEDAIYAKHDPRVVHPSYVLLMSAAGAGATIEEILGLVDFAPEEGALAAAYDLEFDAPLRAEATYWVEGQVTEVERKRGRRLGPFDQLTFTVTITDTASGDLVATVKTTWMLPRREGTDARAE